MTFAYSEANLWPWIIPQPLKKGDRLAVIALSSPGDIKAIEQIKEKLFEFEFAFDFFPSCYASHGHLAGVDQVRLDDLHNAFTDHRYAGILCMKGGAGSYRLLDRIDYACIRKNAKVFIGYSDVTAVHLGIQKMAKIVTFHGPMAYSKWPDFTRHQFAQMVMGSYCGLEILNPPDKPIEVLVPGNARGRLVGGNLSLLVNTLGSPYEVDTRGAILMIEDTLEPTYAIDRMLNALRLAKKFEDAAGIILGTFSHCEPEEKNSYSGRDLDLSTIISELVLPAGKPTISNIQFGHNVPQLTLALGANVEMQAQLERGDGARVTLSYIDSGI